MGSIDAWAPPRPGREREVDVSLERSLRRQYGYRKQRSPGVPPLPDWLVVPRPEQVAALVRMLCRRRGSRKDITRRVAIVADGAAAGFGLSIVARMVCADPRVRRRFGHQTWWLTAGPDTRDEPGLRVRVHQRNIRFAGTRMRFDGSWESWDEGRVLGMYRRLLLVVDDAAPGPGRPDRLLSGKRGHVNLVTVLDHAQLPYQASAVAIDVAPIERAARDALRTRTGQLPAGGADRLAELGVFAEGEALPLALLATLWQATAAMTADDAASLCATMARLSLVLIDAADTVRVDPVVRAIGRETPLTEVNTALVHHLARGLPRAPGLAGPGPDRAWWRLDDRYLRHHLVARLVDAGEHEQAVRLAGDLRWVAERLVQDGPVAPYGDLAAAARTEAPDAAAARRDALLDIAEQLDATEPPGAVVDVLLDRLRYHPVWGSQARAMQAATDRPILLRRPPDQPLSQVLSRVRRAWDVDLSPDDRLLAVVGGESWVACLDLTTGEHRTMSCRRNSNAVSVEFSPDGTWLAARVTNAKAGWGAEDPPAFTYVHVWDVKTGRERFVVNGWYQHQIWGMAVGADSTWLFTHAEDADRGWNAFTGQELSTLPASGVRPSHPRRTETTSRDGAWRATVDQNELRLWDLTHDRPGPMMRVEANRHDSLSGTIWLPDNGLLAYGNRGLYLFDIAVHGGPGVPATVNS